MKNLLVFVFLLSTASVFSQNQIKGFVVRSTDGNKRVIKNIKNITFSEATVMIESFSDKHYIVFKDTK